MFEYSLFGGRLLTDEAFPELVSASTPGVPTWHMRQVTDLPSPTAPVQGREELYSSAEARLRKTQDGYLLEIDAVGLFTVSSDGGEIAWESLPGAYPEFVRSHLLGRVMALALHRQGVLTLHGSAVEIGGQAVCFLAPKFAGKSTLAGSLTARGGRLLTDDTIAVRLDGPSVLPGVPAIRLAPEAAAVLGFPTTPDLTVDQKVVVHGLPDDRVASDPVPLAAVYLLQPVQADPGMPPVVRERVSGQQAVLGMTGHSRIVALLGAECATLLDQLSGLAERVPVYALGVERDLGPLTEVAATIAGWHEPSQQA